MNRKIAVISAVVLILLVSVVVACGPTESPSMEAPPAAPTMAPADDEAAEDNLAYAPEGSMGTVVGQPDLQKERMVVHTVELSLIVESVEDTLPQVEALIRDKEGYIVSSRTYRTYTDRLAATITLRVPADSLDQALGELKGMAWKITEEQRSGQDVTDQYVDLESRLRALQTTEEELLALLQEVRQSEGNAQEKADAILSIYNQLTTVRSQIEEIQGRMQYLEQMSAMATITVVLNPREPETVRPVVEEEFDPGKTFRDAARTLLEILQAIADGLIWFVTVVLPMLLILALIWGIPIWLIVRWRRRRRRES